MKLQRLSSQGTLAHTDNFTGAILCLLASILSFNIHCSEMIVNICKRAGSS